MSLCFGLFIVHRVPRCGNYTLALIIAPQLEVKLLRRVQSQYASGASTQAAGAIAEIEADYFAQVGNRKLRLIFIAGIPAT
jgi:hypothetical protein